MSECIFCAISSGRLPASRVWEDEAFIAFMDIFPMRPGHVLIIPRHHVDRLHELPVDERAALFTLGTRIAAAQRATGADDVNYIINDGPAANQSVPHVHLHVVPRRRGDTLRLLGRLLRKPVEGLLGPTNRGVLDSLARELGTALERPRP